MLTMERHPESCEIIVRDDATGAILLNPEGFSYFANSTAALEAMRASGQPFDRAVPR